MEQYIKKSTLVAEIEKKIMQYEVAFNNPSFASYEASLIAKGKYRKLLDIRQFLDTLEVKEVDVNKEIDNYLLTYWNEEREKFLHPFLKKMCVHFFKLGIIASNKV